MGQPCRRAQPTALQFCPVAALWQQGWCWVAGLKLVYRTANQLAFGHRLTTASSRQALLLRLRQIDLGAGQYLGCLACKHDV